MSAAIMLTTRELTPAEMTELEMKAAKGEKTPEDLSAPERMLFIALRGLYFQYRNGVIDKEQAKKEKALVLNDYRAAVLDEKCREKSRKLWQQLPLDIMKCDCPECKALAKLILGLN